MLIFGFLLLLFMHYFALSKVDIQHKIKVKVKKLLICFFSRVYVLTKWALSFCCQAWTEFGGFKALW